MRRVTRLQGSLHATARRLARPSPTRTFTLELAQVEIAPLLCRVSLRGQQPIPATGLSPVRNKALWAARRKHEKNKRTPMCRSSTTIVSTSDPPATRTRIKNEWQGNRGQRNKTKIFELPADPSSPRGDWQPPAIGAKSMAGESIEPGPGDRGPGRGMKQGKSKKAKAVGRIIWGRTIGYAPKSDCSAHHGFCHLDSPGNRYRGRS